MDNSSVNTDLIRDHVDTIILATLAGGDRYGLDILTEIKEKSKDLYELKQATLYSCLKRLEKLGYVTSYKGDTSNGAQRVYYSLLDDGRKFLENDQYQWEYARTIIDGLLSDKEFDKQKEPPFNASDLRPRTKRQPRSEPSAAESAEVQDSQIIVNQTLNEVEYAPSADDENLIRQTQYPDQAFKLISPNNELKTVIVNKDSVVYEESVDYREVLDNIFDTDVNQQAYTPAQRTDFSQYSSSPSYQETEEQDYSPSSMYSLKNVTAKFKEKGFSIKPYLKQNTTDYYVNKYVYINKIMLTTSIYSFLMYAFVLSIMFISTFKSYGTSIGALFGAIGGFAVVPIYCTLAYLLNPNKRILAAFNFKKTISWVSIFLVNAFLLILMIGFMGLGANFVNPQTVVQSVVFPTILLVLIPVCIVIYSGLYSTKHYHVN